MSDIVKGVLGGAWTLVVGWFLPCGLGLAVFGVFVLPSVSDLPVFSVVADASAANQALVLVAVAVVLGLVLSVLQTPLYRILEGYLLWPAGVASKRIEKHRETRAELHRELVKRRASHGLADAILLEQYLRYPDSDEQIAATMLGNGIRRFEYYGQDRFKLDSQRLWYQLRAATPESLAKEVDLARAGVDFFVCLVYVLGLLALTALVGMFVEPGVPAKLALVLGLSVAGMALCYRSAVVATDAWAAAVRATVDLGRAPLAKALGLRLPDTLENERAMWQGIGWLVTFPHAPETAQYVDPYRVSEKHDDDKNS